MADTTTRYGFPYQELLDPPAGNEVGQELAEAVETTVGAIDDRLGDAEDDIAALELNKPVFVVKSGNTTRASNVTVASDPHLTISLAASATYFVEFFISHGGSTAGGYKDQFTVPSGATGRRGVIGPAVSNVNAGVDGTMRAPSTSAITSGNGFGSAASNGDTFNYETLLITTTNAGTLALQWAQQTSSATGTTVYAGSAMRVTRVA